MPTDDDSKEKRDFEESCKLSVEEIVREHIEDLDVSWTKSNYDYVMNELGNKNIRKVYEILGPMNLSIMANYKFPKSWPLEEIKQALADMKAERVWQQEFMQRKSGAQYRGQVAIHNGRPDGMGLKIFNSTSIYEGFFENGSCHGTGRAISSKGEVYQGEFKSDMMSGRGYFMWPDGRIYEGDWFENKK